MISFYLNDRFVSTSMPPGTTLVDFIRYHEDLKGTKIGCREGDCGACVVLIGEIRKGELYYQAVTSCLTPLANIHHKHVVTVEGINMEGLNPIQQAMADESATQCGFCTPGFVMSFAGFCLNRIEPSYQSAIAAIDGNICRCTGYKSIERAARKIAWLVQNRNEQEPAGFCAQENILPYYFTSIRQQLMELKAESNAERRPENTGAVIGGGTDLYVQRYEELRHEQAKYLFNKPSLKNIYEDGDRCIIGASATVTHLQESPLMNKYFPQLQSYVRLISSTPIRNVATVAGNLVNASPIGDLTVFFLALNATVVLSDGKQEREVLLKNLYKGYKILDKTPGEHVEKIWFRLPGESSHFHFEKVSKRTHLDIASVNSAMSVKAKDGRIEEVFLSAGGVAPIPLMLQRTCDFLKGKWIQQELVVNAIEIMHQEVSPISDVRGSKEYKRLLLAQLIKAHFLQLFNVSPGIPLQAFDVSANGQARSSTN